MLRLDLVRRHWRWYAVVAAIALSMQVGWALMEGLRTSTDFRVRYDPLARYALSELGLAERPSEDVSGAYAWSRIGYISVVATSYALFGQSLAAAVVPQVAITWLIYPVFFHVLLHVTGSLVVSGVAIAFWMSFLDTYQWHFWALPDALYRFLFLVAAFVLLRLWECGRRGAFTVTALAATALLTTFRIETPLYAAPALATIGAWSVRERRGVLVAVVAMGAIVLWIERAFVSEIGRLFVSLFSNGQILPGSGQEIAGVTYLVPPSSGSTAEWTTYYARVFGMRAWQAINPLPPLWSLAHQLYFAAYMVPAYLLAMAGVLAGLHRRSMAFRSFLWIFGAGVGLQILVAVDPSMRYAYTPHVFLFLCAGMGLQASVTAWERRRSRTLSADAV